MTHARSQYDVLIFTVALGIFFNNILRWFPFPPGRSQNDLTGIESNLLGIVVNSAIYLIILLTIMSGRKHWRFGLHSALIIGYSAYVLAQMAFRPSSTIELVRSIALAVMLLSADMLGKWLGGDPNYLRRFTRALWFALVGALFVGLAIGLVLRDSVNWGNGLSPSFFNQIRAEFFFFHILPYPTVAFSLYMFQDKRNRKAIRVLAATSVTIIVVLSVLTMTRSIVFSNLLVIAIFLFRYSKKALVAILLLVGMAMLLVPESVGQVALRLRVDSIFTDNPDIDFTNSRADSYAINLDSFAQSPILGQGGEEARQRILLGDTLAKSEYGYTIHLASYGLFSVLFFAYVIWGAIASLGILFRPGSRRGRSAEFDTTEGIATAVAAITIASVLLGFIWIFGSGTAFYDWLPLVFISMSSAVWAHRRVRIPVGGIRTLPEATGEHSPSPALQPSSRTVT